MKQETNVNNDYFFNFHCLSELLNYLKNRYNDRKEFNVHEVIYRIKNNIEHLPICPICKKPIEFHRKYQKACDCCIHTDEYKKYIVSKR